ncbi:DUF488 domain-containing protein [Corynebacterium sphenisci]|uniref:DUF488 domain-containing protein n=1 Tax=Corynebacterium sphenisci TaxID=191493 RepID=UPI0026DFFCA0|nr:DUF488 family protein [Corynebacterium sphenisci]MDO5731015.1 DUF488 family protein [Corynebacterium sphenisci]
MTEENDAIRTLKIHDLRDRAEPPAGARILVDRMWPRGVAKDDVDLTGRLPQVAPSPGLRKWFGHDPERFAEFTRRYRAELDERLADADHGGGDDDGAADQLRELLDRATAATAGEPLLLVYGAADREHNHAEVLAGWLRERIG